MKRSKDLEEAKRRFKEATLNLILEGKPGKMRGKNDQNGFS